MSTAEDKKAAQAARQAKLLAKSKDRLARITGAGKEEGRVATDASVGITSIASTSSPSASATAVAPAPPLSHGAVDDDPEEVDLALQQSLRATGSPFANASGPRVDPFTQFGPGAGAGGQQQPDLAALMQAMMGGGGPEGASSSPFGPGAGAGGEDIFAQMQAMMGGLGGAGGPGGPQGMQPPTYPFPPAPKTWLDRVFPLVHLLSMLALVIYSVVVLEPQARSKDWAWAAQGSGGVNWAGWAGLLSSRKGTGIVGGIEKLEGSALGAVPLFWAFITVELVLQTTRLLLIRNRPAPPGILNSILPVLRQFAPTLAAAIAALASYFSIFTRCLRDLSVLVFGLGITVLIAKWKVQSEIHSGSVVDGMRDFLANKGEL